MTAPTMDAPTAAPTVPTLAAVETAVLLIPRDRIDPSPTNPRKTFDKADLLELRQSIDAIGLLQPITVRTNGLRYELVAGERRWRATGKLGKKRPALPSIAAIVRDLTDDEVRVAQAVENLQRADVPTIEEAEGFAALVDAGIPVDEIVRRVGKSATYVRQRCALATLLDDGKAAVTDGRLTLGTGIQIARLAPAVQPEVLAYALQEWYGGRRPTEAQVAAHIEQEIFLQLARAPFDRTDATLVPGCGACAACPKRTGFTPALFPDVEDADTCTDGACYQTKVAAHVQRATARALDQMNDRGWRTVYSLSANYGSRSALQAVPRDEYAVVLADDPKRCAHVAGGVYADGSQAGAIIEVCVRPTDEQITTRDVCKKHWKHALPSSTKSPAAKAAETKAKNAQLKRERTALRRALTETIAKVPVLTADQWTVDGSVALPVAGVEVEVLRTIALAQAGRLWNEHQKQVCQNRGWESLAASDEAPAGVAGSYRLSYGWGGRLAGEIVAMDATGLYRLMLEMALTEFAHPSEHDTRRRETTPLHELAARVGVDVAAIRAEIEAAAAPKGPKTAKGRVTGKGRAR